MAKKAVKKEVDINTKIVEELLSKVDPSELFSREGLFNQLNLSWNVFKLKIQILIKFS